jgi:lysophospholipid hydrolase
LKITINYVIFLTTTSLSAVIMTRFSRVTFNAAHGYLGLTSEVLRTEKAINDIACHPLPPAFYEGGGMEQLRQRFDGAGASSSESGDDYFSARPHAPSSSESTLAAALPHGGAFSRMTDKTILHDSPKSSAPPAPPFTPGPGARLNASRNLVQAGDLFSSTPQAESYRSRVTAQTPYMHPRLRSANAHAYESKLVTLKEDEFDLRQEVMNCIAVSIGLQPQPLSGDASVEASPAFAPTEWGSAGEGEGARGAGLVNSFSSLSLLEMGDDRSSSTTHVSSITGNGYMTGLDNEVEILFFSAGSHLARAGEKDTGASCAFPELPWC